MYAPAISHAAVLFLALSVFLWPPSPLSAQTFEVPEGFVIEDAIAGPPETDREPVLQVRPIDGPFSNLSTIVLERVIEPIADPDAWLTDRVSGDVSGATGAVEGILDSPDSPFADPAFDRLRESLPQLLSGLETLSRLPLSFCDEPSEAYNSEGPLRELYCVFQLGPLRQYLVLRIQEAGGAWYYTTIQSMNERRLRHLIAIANSFSLDGGSPGR